MWAPKDVVSGSSMASQQATEQSGDRQATGINVQDDERLRGDQTEDDLVQCSSSRVQHARPSVRMETSVLFNEWEKG